MVVGADKSVWDIAVSEMKKKKDSDDIKSLSPNQATVVFVGSRGAGKTTLSTKLTNIKDTQINPTLALEYIYYNITDSKRLTNDKQVAHFWELGGGALFSSLLTTPISLRSIASLSVFIVLDLSRLEVLWNDLEKLLKAIKERIDAVVDSKEGKKLNLREKLSEAAWQRVGEEHQDKDSITPLLVPLVIVGGKYDIFKTQDPDIIKTTCRALRFVAHVHGASLRFFSKNDVNLKSTAQTVLKHHAFGKPDSTAFDQDYNKPLMIPVGSDSLRFISGTLEEPVSMTLDTWKHMFTAKVPQIDEAVRVLGEDPAKDQKYAEPDIDNLRSHKDLALERLQKSIGIDARYGDVDLASME